MSDPGIYLKLGWRNLWLHPVRTLLTSAGLATGIGALVFLSALDDGWLQQIKTNFALTLTGHIQIHAAGFEQTRRIAQHIEDPAPVVARLEAFPEIEVVAPRIRASGLASSANGNAGAWIYGVEPEAERRLSRLAGFLKRGRWLAPADRHDAVIGQGLAERLDVELGDKLVVMSAGPGGEIVSEMFRVRGILHSGVMEMDDALVLVPIGMAQQWLGIGAGVTDLALRIRDFERVGSLARQLRELFADRGLEVLTWYEIDPMAQQWAEFADAYTWIVLAIVIVIVLAEVLNTMLMSLHERTREFGLMRALGATRGRLFLMVVWETVILVAFGAVAGLGLGASLSLAFARNGIDLSRFAEAFSFMYMEPVVHPMLQAESLGRIVLATLVGALLAGLWPALRASRMEPAAALRSL